MTENNPVSYLDSYFCNLCLEPLGSENNGICPSCGQKTTPISLAERLNADKTLDKRTKSTPRSMAVIITIACIIHLIYCVTAFAVLLKAVYFPAPEQTVVAETSSYVFPITEEDERISRLYKKALEYDDAQEFVKEMSPHGQEEIKYYYGIWNNVQMSKAIADRAENTPTVTYNNSNDDKNAGNFLGFIGGTGGILIALFESAATIIHLEKCIMFFLGRKGLGYLVNYTLNHCQTVIYTLNIPCHLLFMFASVEISRVNVLLGGDKLRASRRARIFRAKQLGGFADDKQWCCEGCGYINPSRVSECISCGKYKPLPQLKKCK